MNLNIPKTKVFLLTLPKKKSWLITGILRKK